VNPLARDRVGDRAGQPRAERDRVELGGILGGRRVAGRDRAHQLVDPAHRADLRDHRREPREQAIAAAAVVEHVAARARLRRRGHAELAGQRAQPRLINRHPLATEIHDRVADPAGVQPAADPRPRLDHDHIEPGLAQPPRAHQAGEPGADDDHVVRHGGHRGAQFQIRGHVLGRCGRCRRVTGAAAAAASRAATSSTTPGSARTPPGMATGTGAVTSARARSPCGRSSAIVTIGTNTITTSIQSG